MGNPASEFAVTLGRGYDFAQQVDDKDAARRRTAIDLYSADCSHHLVIDASGLDHRANADRAREGLISLHRHLRARYGRHTPETVHARLLFAVIKSVAIDRRSLGARGEAADLDEEVEVFMMNRTH
jgi:hypothetical protein